MQRRTFLTFATGGEAALADCSSDKDETATAGGGGEVTSTAATTSSTPT